MNHAAHEMAILISLLCSAFIAYVAIRCYRASGEQFVGWLALALIGETLIYAPHGIFTRLSADHMALFLIYGPASRLIMAVLLLAGQISYDRRAHRADEIAAQRLWPWICGFGVINVALGWCALALPGSLPVLRILIESGALAVTGTALAMMLARPRHPPLMRLYSGSLVGFMTASLIFIAAAPWTHLWWYAHAVFAAAFLVLSYGVLAAFRSSGSFSGVFSQEQMMERLRAAKVSAEQANTRLNAANAQLLTLATTDSLTGVANRRHLMEQAVRELERANRTHAPLTLLLLDLDHFKETNDRFGHASGDQVLKQFIKQIVPELRGQDVIGRVGGEEFVVLMPETGPDQAQVIAHRLCRLAREVRVQSHDGQTVQVSVSIGASFSGSDGNTISDLLRVADRRLYAAKEAGRDRAVLA